MSIPPIQANPRTSTEIKDSCNCSCGSTCWPKRKTTHHKKASQDHRIKDISERNVYRK